ncbi:efflux RND transporter periplasmic adaptor subunit [Methylomonas sp. BW4-1]|uniref:efflux RND transporter periplasmic adaptor subunit n=1 Tax=unclassified Methylomonas TaxID=2608980 RepID=UPI000C32EA07|nr:efflux RND transporter periplasmic adaptor subunit [Methylomonas sp. Kb3]PKD40339.1 efflux transporter periplasmic adaptor subunit [Methylomonas sp. Kb3]
MKYLLLTLPLLLAACEKPAPTASAPRPALVVTVGEQTAAAPIILIGEIRSRYESAQGFRINGKIIERNVDTGAVVTKGQLLAKLDSMDTGLSTQAAQAEVRAAEADLALAQAELDRQRQLHASKFISNQALDIQEAQFKAAAARVKQTRAQAAVTGNQSRYTQLLAERDGVVTRIQAEPGQVVAAGEPIVRIAVPENKEVEIAVPESRMLGIAVDVPAEIRLWANPTTVYQGKVREVAPAADNLTRTFQVRVVLLDADDSVRLGMTAGVRFYHQDTKDFLLPTTALTQRDGQSVVWVVNPANGEVQPRTVQAGAFREDGVLIAGGIQKGEQVVVAGVQTLIPGQKVRATPLRSQP